MTTRVQDRIQINPLRNQSLQKSPSRLRNKKILNKDANSVTGYIKGNHSTMNIAYMVIVKITATLHYISM